LLEVRLAVILSIESGVASKLQETIAMSATEARLVEDLLIGRDLLGYVDRLATHGALLSWCCLAYCSRFLS